MKIRKADGYILDCECGCELHFYDEDIYVCERITDDKYPLLPLEDWYGLPFNEALKYTYHDNGNWKALALRCWIKCPECGTHWQVWHNRIFTTKYFKKEDESKSVDFLIKDGQVVVSQKIDMDDFDVYPCHGPEEEL